MTKPTPKAIKAIADTAGIAVSDDDAARIATSMGPAFEGFAPVAGMLPRLATPEVTFDPLF